jgi:hypothetical protein
MVGEVGQNSKTIIKVLTRMNLFLMLDGGV